MSTSRPCSTSPASMSSMVWPGSMTNLTSASLSLAGLSMRSLNSTASRSDTRGRLTMPGDSSKKLAAAGPIMGRAANQPPTTSRMMATRTKARPLNAPELALCWWLWRSSQFSTMPTRPPARPCGAGSLTAPPPSRRGQPAHAAGWQRPLRDRCGHARHGGQPLTARRRSDHAVRGPCEPPPPGC